MILNFFILYNAQNSLLVSVTKVNFFKIIKEVFKQTPHQKVKLYEKLILLNP
tara:strand:+ start:2188 stop:2343 length:156 start_codon:yes stop_codon:yes gene_type:complete